MFAIGVGTTIAALAVSLLMRELPLRGNMGARKVTQGSVGAEAAVGADAFDEVADDDIPPLTMAGH